MYDWECTVVGEFYEFSICFDFTQFPFLTELFLSIRRFECDDSACIRTNRTAVAVQTVLRWLLNLFLFLRLNCAKMLNAEGKINIIC